MKLKALEEEHVMEMDRFRIVTDSQIKLKNLELENEKDKNEKLLMVVATITENSEKQAEIIETLSTDMKTVDIQKSSDRRCRRYSQEIVECRFQAELPGNVQFHHSAYILNLS